MIDSTEALLIVALNVRFYNNKNKLNDCIARITPYCDSDAVDNVIAPLRGIPNPVEVVMLTIQYC